VLIALVVLGARIRPAVAADDSEACIVPYEAGQIARQEGHLQHAREVLLECARAACPPPIRKDCNQWVEEVNQAMPSVIIDARDSKGADVAGLRFSVDGKLVVGGVDGKPVDIDPGVHQLRFEAPGWPPIDKRIVIRQGEKERRIVVHIGEPPVHPESPAERPIPLTAYVLGGVGAAALGVSAYFGIRGLGERSDLNDMNCKPHCAQGDVDQVMTHLRLADAFLAMGVVSFGVATYLVVHRPEAEVSRETSSALSVEVGARAARRGGSADLTVRF
jgi:hypothetical protein